MLNRHRSLAKVERVKRKVGQKNDFLRELFVKSIVLFRKEQIKFNFKGGPS